MAISKITYPLTGKELSVKINEIIDGIDDVLEIGVVTDVEIVNGYTLKVVKHDGGTITMEIPKAIPATSDADGLIKAADYTFIQNLKKSKDDETSALPTIIPYATCPTGTNTTDKVATIVNGGVLTKLTQGTMVMVAFQYPPYITGDHKMKLNVNNTGLKEVTYCGIADSYYTVSRNINRVLFVYDGTYWVAITPFTYTYSSDD